VAPEALRVALRLAVVPGVAAAVVVVPPAAAVVVLDEVELLEHAVARAASAAMPTMAVRRVNVVGVNIKGGVSFWSGEQKAT
jgi:hypothetical protein